MSEETVPESVVGASPMRGGAVVFIFVTLLLDMFALGLIMPILPKLVESFVANDTASAARIFGLFGTVWALMQFFFSPILGGLSDRFGRRPVVLLSNFGLALDYVLMALAPSLMWLFVGRVISGITSASVSTAFAYIADITPPEKRAALADPPDDRADAGALHHHRADADHGQRQADGPCVPAISIGRVEHEGRGQNHMGQLGNEIHHR